MINALLTEGLSFNGAHAQLEPLQLAHVGDLIAAAQDGDLAQLTLTSVPTEQEMHGYVEQAIVAREQGSEMPFVVRLPDTGKIVGTTRYYQISQEHRNCAIGYTWYAQSVHRTGVNSQCKLMLLEHAFEVAQCISVAWHTHHDNLKSQHAIQRLGAKQDGILRNHKIMRDGSIRHTVCFSMLDSEWPTAKVNLLAKLVAYS